MREYVDMDKEKAWYKCLEISTIHGLYQKTSNDIRTLVVSGNILSDVEFKRKLKLTIGRDSFFTLLNFCPTL